MKRILLFVATNLAVMVVLGIVTRLFGLDRMVGTSMVNLLVYAAVIGFTGAIISLLMSKTMAKMGSGAEVINDSPDPTHQWIVTTVAKHADKAGIKMPEVAIFPGQANAFATGAFKNSALVAVSTGLLQSMNRDEVDAVIGHEVAHIANGDMVTMTLIQGVMNTFVVFASRAIGSVVDRTVFRNENGGPGVGYMVTTLVLDLVFGVLAAIIVAWFSR
jgi:heat shock protein HtpX